MIHSDQEGCRTFCKPTRKRRLPRGDLSAKKMQRRYTSRFHGLGIFCLISRFKSPLDHFRPGRGQRQVPPCRLCPESGSKIRILASASTGRSGLMRRLPG